MEFTTIKIKLITNVALLIYYKIIPFELLRYIFLFTVNKQYK